MSSFPRQQRLPGLESDDDSSPPPPPSPPPAPSPDSALPSAEASRAPSKTLRASSSPPQPESLRGRTVYVVDSNSLIFQVFHALPEMTSTRGEPVNAVYGFVRDVLFLLEKKKPDCLLCAFDLPGPTFRDAIYDQYKAGRSEMPDELRPQFPKIRQTLDAFGIPMLDCEGYEADDVLATVARECEELGGECLLITADKDCRQLITDRVQIYNLRKDVIYDAAALQQDWRIRPDQAVDFQALVGDSVDNVPGVSLIGPKIAGELLATYDTLEAVLEHAEEVKGAKRRQNLIEGREVALMSRSLVRLDAHVPIEIDWNGGQPGQIDHDAVFK